MSVYVVVAADATRGSARDRSLGLAQCLMDACRFRSVSAVREDLRER
jgi:hypothetical protein